jgi:Glycosyl hydrolase family 26
MRMPLRQIKLLVAALACLSVLAVGSAAGASGASTSATHRPLYWGAWIGNQITGEEPPWDMSAVARFEKKLGKGLSMLEFSAPLAECTNPDEHASCKFSAFPTDAMQTIRDYGAIPFLSWSSAATPEDVEEPDFQLSDLLSHRYDQHLKAFAKEAAEWGHPFFLRFDWEMNGSWFPWASGENGNRPAEYVRAWRRVHDIFKAAGATNANWVWCPYVRPEGKTASLARYYPGNSYVDWTCLDAYNFGQNSSNPRPWQSFDKLLRPSYEAVTEQIAPGKPMVLGELASNGPPARKARWIRQMFAAIAGHYPAVGGLVWFDKFDRDLRWPLETNAGPTHAFRAGLRRYPYLGNQFSELDASPIPPPH